MAEPSTNSNGSRVAAMLAGSWRSNPPGCERTLAELEEMAPLLIDSGAAALCWRGIRQTELQTARAAKPFRQAYRRNILQEALQQERIEEIFRRLRASGVEPVLVKGWAAAQAYPEAGLRPCGDIDLCVRPEDFAAAEALLADLEEKRSAIDLHCGFDKFGGGKAEVFYERSRLVRLRATEVRLLCAEDHLRVLAIHLLREGAWRPLWLCDLAAAVERRPETFDWNLCLGRNRLWADAVICALRLARALLGADLSGTPAEGELKPLPRWLVETLLKEWGSKQPLMKQRHRAPMANCWRYPAKLMAGLRHRWPNPIEATISLRGPFNRLPRLPFQLGTYLARSARFAARLPKLLRQQ